MKLTISKKEYSIKALALPIGAIIVLCIVSIGLLIYRNTLQANLTAASHDTLQNVIQQQRFTFASKLLDQKGVVQTYADSLENAADLSRDELLKKLKVIAKNSTFDYVSFATLDGIALRSTGETLNIREREYFQRAVNGETTIADPITSKITDANIITFSTPVLNKGSIVGVLTGIYDAGNLSKLLLPTFGGKGHTYVTTNTGEIIVRAKSGVKIPVYDNFFEALKPVKHYEIENYETIMANVSIGNSGFSRFQLPDGMRLMRYVPTEINDWYLFLIVPDSVVAPRAVDIMYNTTLFIFLITVLSLLALIYYYFTQKRHMKELTQIAFVDTLTGAANRKRFKLSAAELLAVSHEHYAFIILDIDKFKVLNDTLGYECGDALLISIAEILRKHIGEKELFGRCDSDEFFLLQRHVDDQTTKATIQAIISRIEAHFHAQFSDTYRLVLCAGIYVISNSLESINVISDKARLAHKLVKGRGESGISFFDEEIRVHILQEKDIENRMQAALENDEFLLYLQPKYYLESELIYGAEALVRWQPENAALVYPGQFIPLFEKNGFVTKLDMYMLEKTCKAIRSWIDAGVAPVPVSTNFSRLHLKNPHFVGDIAAIVEKYNIPPELIEVELTESTMLDNEVVLIDMLIDLHEHGFTLSMDDFGSGYSSLGLLKNLPVDVIKLDRTFFVDYSELERAVTVISSMISMAKSLGIKTVAEGVETKEQVEFLRTLGCDIVQGYYYARPMAAGKLIRILRLGRHWVADDTVAIKLT